MVSNIIKITVLSTVFLLSWGNAVIASPIAKTWIYATILIENEWGGKGTGFLVSRETSNDKGKIFLCTNKHVLNKNKKLRERATKITCYINIEEKDGTVVGKNVKIPLVFSDGTRRWREHPDDFVDVLVFDITNLIIAIPSMVRKWASYDLFVDEKILKEQDITIGEDVMIIGYPSGFVQGETNFPIVRQGIIASQIGQKYIEIIKDKQGNVVEKKIYRGFLIDGGLIPGSSGSPVILKPVIGRYIGSDINFGPTKPYLLGIVAETRYAGISTNEEETIPSFADLGIAFDAITIKETIELFFND